MVDQNGPHYFVAFQTAGPKWVNGVPYNEQPEFMKHVEFISGLHDQGKVLLSGPFMKEPGGLAGKLDDDGMTIFRASDLEEAMEIATSDPTVQSGMLKVEVRTFWVPFHE